MILVVLAALCAATVPLRGGRLARLADVRLRGLWLPLLALAVQVIITEVLPGGSPALHRGLHVATYGGLAVFMWLNRRLPGLRIMATGTALNMAAIIANRGVMPASRTAERISGLSLRAGFANSAPVSHALAPWLGDVIPWPGPLHNVLSIGDVLIFAGTAVLLHRCCAAPACTPDDGATVDAPAPATARA